MDLPGFVDHGIAYFKPQNIKRKEVMKFLIMSCWMIFLIHVRKIERTALADIF